MTDLLQSQAEIKSRYHPKAKQPREAGQFVNSATAIALHLAIDRMKIKLPRDVKADEHARGVVWEDGHYHKLPGYVAPVSDDGSAVEHTAEVLPLFERAA